MFCNVLPDLSVCHPRSEQTRPEPWEWALLHLHTAPCALLCPGQEGVRCASAAGGHALPGDRTGSTAGVGVLDFSAQQARFAMNGVSDKSLSGYMSE